MNKYEDDDSVEIDSVVSDEKEKEVVRNSIHAESTPNRSQALGYSSMNITEQIEEIQKNIGLGKLRHWIESFTKLNWVILPHVPKLIHNESSETSGRVQHTFTGEKS